MTDKQLDILAVILMILTLAACVWRWHLTSKRYVVSASRFRWFGFFASFGGLVLAFGILAVLFAAPYNESIFRHIAHSQILLSATLTIFVMFLMLISSEICRIIAIRKLSKISSDEEINDIGNPTLP
ncbi:MAG: hypothetical protein EOO50_12340 [Flavobacterium sp.]|uniref:hypothetical protein n=1 Tax=Flavobacterium sp. TaxID=239 RepID=UPI001213621D|nr:hypothetical protein [Flavobacterium sp.]RZJ65797.1 MAG: hypothetical protein EOO50_12340 [Flavobacterium sp.]